MPTFSQRNFSGGELSPAHHGNVNAEKYVTGAKSLYNMTVLRSGGISNRPGTEFVDEVYDSTKKTRIIPYLTPNEDPILVELSPGKIRLFSGDTLFERARVFHGTVGYISISGVTKATPGVVTAGTHGFSNGDTVMITDVVGMTELNDNVYTARNITATTFELYDSAGPVNTTAYTTYTSGGIAWKVANQITTAFTESELPEVHYAQQDRFLVLTHRNHRPQLLRVYYPDAEIPYVPLVNITSESLTLPVTSLARASGGDAGSTTYTVYAVAPNGEESLVNSVTESFVGTSSNPLILGWALQSAAGYNNAGYAKVFRNGYYIGDGHTGTTTFTDLGQAAGFIRTQPKQDLLKINGSNPPITVVWNTFQTVAFFQERQLFGGDFTEDYFNPSRIVASRSFSFGNYEVFNEPTDDQAFDVTISQSRKSAEIRHLVDFTKLVVFTEGAVHLLNGDEAGAVYRQAINRTQIASHGAALMPQPVVAGQGLLYVQDGGSIVRDLASAVESTKYKGNDLTVFASHLFDGHTIVAWAFQEIPHPITWAVRDDGALLCLAYLSEYGIWGWTKCELANDAIVEDACVLSNGDTDTVYFIVKRGADRYIEKLTNRYISDIKDAKFLDSCLSYDGRNTTTAHTMTLSASGWTYADEITITSSTAYFSSAEVGNEIHLTGSDGTIIRLALTGYTSPTVMTGAPNKTVPAGMRATAISSWTRAVDEVSGLDHLEGEAVGVFGDGFVVANPINPKFTNTITVTSGAVTLPRCYGVIQVGLPYYSEIETLDIDVADKESFVGKKIQVGKVHVRMEQSRGFFAGNRSTATDATLLTGLYESKIRNNEDYDSPVSLGDGVVELLIKSEWNSNGRVLVRNVDPIPFTVLSIHPEGSFPIAGRK